MNRPDPQFALRALSAEELACQAQGGSSASFAALVTRFEGRLLKYLERRTQTVQDAEDLVQETFLKAYRNLARYEPKRRFSTWLFTIATRSASNHHRSQRRRARVADIEPHDADASPPDEALSRHEERESLWALVANVLPQDQHTALWLRYVEDMSVKEIAGVMGKTRVHVKVILYRGRQRLAESLPRRFTESESVPRCDTKPIADVIA
ncbi:MAG: sigma-70 family RNA polymerase sigma factor, partial [Planctomycetia bacterium]|nr:sigma-70 family RNA polymerase sigma factor [Planctomycetia bacterium]